MTGEIGVHNDAYFVVNGKIGEDCGIGAVTIKELKGLPDCGCGDCNGIMGFWDEESVVVAQAVENGNLGRKEGEKDGVCSAAMTGSGDDGVGLDRKEVFENGRADGDDLIGNCVGEEAEVKKRENGVLENEDCGTNGHVTEIKVDLAKGNQGDEGVERTSEEVENGHGADENGENGVLENEDCGTNGHVTEIVVDLAKRKQGEKGVEGISEEVENGHGADKNGENGVLLNGDCCSDGFFEESKVEVVEENIGDANAANSVQETDITDHNDLSNCNGGEDCSLSNGVAREESLSGSLDAKLEDTGVEDQNGRVDVVDSADVPMHNAAKSDDGGDVSMNGMNTMQENLSMEETIATKSEMAAEIHDDAIPTAAEPQSDITDFEAPSANENKDYGDSAPIKQPECLVASAEEDPKLDVDDVQEDSVNVSSVAAKEEPVHVEVEKEYPVKDEVTDSDPVETISETRAENDSTSAGNVDIEAVICFGSFGLGEFSNISEDVTEKKEDQHTVPEPEAEQSFPRAEVVDATPQTEAVVAEAPQVAASPKGEPQVSEVDKKLFNFLIKFPRFEDDRLKSKISDAQLQVDEKTKRRDAFKAEMHGKKAIYKESSEKFGAAVMEEKAARDLLKSKRQGIDSVQIEINKVKNAMSLGEIDTEISDMERRIQHETLPLKEERELINKIRKLKQLRGQMSSSIGGQDELTEALNNREQTEERLKTLKRDADSLRENCLKAEAVTKATKKIYHDDVEKLHELQARFKEADEIRQDAYVQLQSLKKELYEKNKPFWKYRDDAKMATDLALKGELESLSLLCIGQVETFMEAWNKSNEFREEYLKLNARRTLRRLGTADGRSLGPNEEVPSLPPIVNERPVPKKSFPPLASTKQETVVQDVGIGLAADNVSKKDPDTKKQKPKARNAVKAPSQLETLLAIVERDEIVEGKEPKLTEEEWESARKAEELRKKEEAEKLLEQRRLEEKAKAKEALERKKRNAERAEARAAQKAQKEAEQKEKEREKRAKKKEKKKLAGNTSSDDIPEGESRISSEVAVEAAALVEPEVREKSTPTRRPPKPSHFSKQTKIAPIPAPLRNRGKRKMQPWMWVALVAVLVFLLFLMGNVWNLF